MAASKLVVLFALAFASWMQATASPPEDPAMTELLPRGIDSANSAIAQFMRHNMRDFIVERPIPCGSVSYSNNGKKLINIGGSLNVELAAVWPIFEEVYDVDLNAAGEGSAPHIKISMRVWNVLISGTHTLHGDVGQNVTLGEEGGGGRFTITPPGAPNTLNATCNLKVGVDAGGYLQLGSCYSTTGLISLAGAAVEFSPNLLDETDLVQDVHGVALTRGGSTIGTRLGAGFMTVVVSHMQRAFSDRKLVDIISGSWLPVGTPAVTILEQEGEGLRFPRVQVRITEEKKVITDRIDEFARQVILNVLAPLEPYVPGSGATLSYNKPVLQLAGRVSNVGYRGLVQNSTLAISTCLECSNIVVDVNLGVSEGELFGHFDLNGTIGSEIPFEADGSFVLRNISAKFWFQPKFDVVQGRFAPTSTSMLLANFEWNGGEANFQPDVFGGVDLAERSKAYLNDFVVWMIVDQLRSGYANGIRDVMYREILQKFRDTPALDVILGGNH